MTPCLHVPDPDAAEVAALWPSVSPGDRVAILAAVKAAAGQPDGQAATAAPVVTLLERIAAAVERPPSRRCLSLLRTCAACWEASVNQPSTSGFTPGRFLPRYPWAAALSGGWQILRSGRTS
jgi:hypothetical protein